MPSLPLHLLRRSTSVHATTGFTPGAGAKPPTAFNNQAFLALFATIGGLMVLASLWFFFWAKNGGFTWKQEDWDDYKSTVLRRKGPDGRTLSCATKSTKLGGSTIAGTQRYNRGAVLQAKSVVSYDEKGRKGILGKRGWAKTHSVYYSDDFTDATETVGDMSEVRGEQEYRRFQSQPDADGREKRYRDRDVQDYKRERPARVGGLNRVADGSSGVGTMDGSHVSSASSTAPILSKPKAQEKERAERAARLEAAKMERRWKREAEEAAAALARESVPAPRKAAVPSSSKTPASSKQRQASRSNSPKKREYNYGGAAGAASEVLSTAYTSSGSEGQRTASYYDAYRPQAASGTRGQSPTKKKNARASAAGTGYGGYRRGADGDLD